MVPRVIQDRRDPEFAEARTAAEVDALQKQWIAEDRVLAEAASPLAKQADDIVQRLRKVEHAVAPGGYLAKALGEVLGRLRKELITPLQKRVDELEQRPVLAYRGIYDETITYDRGDACTHQGGLWLCLSATMDRPGRGVDWRLIIKSGDAK
jgi:hypothetical protein